MAMTMVCQYDRDYEPYQFSLFAIFHDGENYWDARDSGCSCPMPWEDHTDEYIRAHGSPLAFPGALKALDDDYQGIGNPDGYVCDSYRRARQELRDYEEKL